MNKEKKYSIKKLEEIMDSQEYLIWYSKQYDASLHHAYDYNFIKYLKYREKWKKQAKRVGGKP